jgi:hypothetical protein
MEPMKPLKYIASGIATGARRGRAFGGEIGYTAWETLGTVVGGAVAPAAMAARGVGRGVAAGAAATYGAMAPKVARVKRSVEDFRWRNLDPASWSRPTLFRGGIGMMAAGAAGGFVVGRGQQPYPLMESGNISLAKPATQRMNFSTAGLTQALHDRRRTLREER